jgi:hypothetical protein
MSKKLTLLGMMVAALAALVVPAAASATPELKNQTSGLKVAVGSQLMATNVGAIAIEDTKFGTFTCNAVSLGAELTKNGGTAIEAKSVIPATNAASTCTTSIGQNLVIDEPTLTSLVTNSTTTDEGTLGISSKATIGTAPVVCSYSGSGAFTYKTGTGNDILTVTKANPIQLSSTSICEKESTPAKFSGTFTLEVDTSGKETGPMDPVFVG